MVARITSRTLISQGEPVEPSIRTMFKFIFTRSREPTGPEWAHDPAAPPPDFAALAPVRCLSPSSYQHVTFVVVVFLCRLSRPLPRRCRFPPPRRLVIVVVFNILRLLVIFTVFHLVLLLVLVSNRTRRRTGRRPRPSPRHSTRSGTGTA